MNVNTQTTALYIVQCGEVVEECSAPWCPTIRQSFECQYKWYKKMEWRTVKVEAIDDREAIEKYHEKIDASVRYFNS